MPNSSTTGTRYENAGIVCIASSTGRITRSTEGRLPAQIPTGMPISSAMMTANRISARVSMLGTHSPSTPMNTKPHAASTARRQPATRPAIAAASATNPSQVMRARTRISWSYADWIPFRSGSRMLTKSGLVRWFAITQSLNALNFAATSTVNDSGNPPESCSPIAITMITAIAQIPYLSGPDSRRRAAGTTTVRSGAPSSSRSVVGGVRTAISPRSPSSPSGPPRGPGCPPARRPPPRGRDGRSSP